MDIELKKWINLLRNKGALTNGVPSTETFDNTTDSLEATRDALRVPTADSANNTNESDVIGNKTDTNAGNSIYSANLVQTADAATNVRSRDVIGNKSDAAVTAVGVVASIIAYVKGIVNTLAGVNTRSLGVQEVILYPVAPTAGTTELAEDGTSFPYYPAVADSTTNNAEGTPGTITFTVDFEQEGTITIMSIVFEGEWQTKYTVNSGDGTASLSKWQISRDAGNNWVDVTDNWTNASLVYVNRIRAGVGQWIPTIVAGTNQLRLRLAHWTNDSIGGGARSSSEAQVRSNSYVRITYRKS